MEIIAQTTGVNIALSQEKGFTIIELMVVLAVASILLVLATPGFMDTSAKAAIRAGATDLASDIAYARSAAITRSTSVSLCPSDASNSPRACNDGDWNDGWLVFYDVDEDGDLDAVDEIVRVGSSLSESLEITLDNTLTFDRRGAKSTVSEFTICSSLEDSAFFTRSLIINIGGLVRGSRDTDGDGIHNSGESGGNLACP